MAQRLRLASALLLVVALIFFSGCKPKAKPPVIVHLLRNLSSPYGSDLDRRILDFQGTNPRVRSGARIVIESETGDYKDMLQKQTSTNDNIDLIILDSPDDAIGNATLQTELLHAANACAGLKACPANIPSIIPAQITGDPRDAALAFQAFLQKTP